MAIGPIGPVKWRDGKQNREIEGQLKAKARAFPYSQHIGQSLFPPFCFPHPQFALFFAPSLFCRPNICAFVFFTSTLSEANPKDQTPHRMEMMILGGGRSNPICCYSSPHTLLFCPSACLLGILQRKNL